MMRALTFPTLVAHLNLFKAHKSRVLLPENTSQNTTVCHNQVSPSILTTYLARTKIKFANKTYYNSINSLSLSSVNIYIIKKIVFVTLIGQK